VTHYITTPTARSDPAAAPGVERARRNLWHARYAIKEEMLMVSEPVPYEELHAVVVDAIRYAPTTGDIDGAAHEALQRLREAGVPIPPAPAGG
jgi:uncharacterized glyoxalase superfamily protein PhnB